MLKEVILSLCSVASIISLAFINQMTIFLRVAIIIIGVLCIVYLLINTFNKERLKKIVCNSDSEIKDYMYQWVNYPGKVCLVSRDLSWVDGKIENLLKSKENNITIYVQKETDLTKRLQNAGVHISYYGKFNFEPQSRFTIIRCNKPDKQIALGRTISSLNGETKHTIYQTNIHGDMKDGWILTLASDLSDLLSLTCSQSGEGRCQE